MPSTQGTFGYAVRNVTVRSQVSPSFSFQPGSPSPSPRGQNPILAIVKPEIILDTVAGRYTVAPWGEPERDYTPLGYVALGLMGIGAICVVRWMLKV